MTGTTRITTLSGVTPGEVYHERKGLSYQTGCSTLNDPTSKCHCCGRGFNPRTQSQQSSLSLNTLAMSFRNSRRFLYHGLLHHQFLYILWMLLLLTGLVTPAFGQATSPGTV